MGTKYIAKNLRYSLFFEVEHPRPLLFSGANVSWRISLFFKFLATNMDMYDAFIKFVGFFALRDSDTGLIKRPQTAKILVDFV